MLLAKVRFAETSHVFRVDGFGDEGRAYAAHQHEGQRAALDFLS